MNDFETKDSGERAVFDSGMQRDTQDNKPRFDLLFPEGQPYTQTFLYRWAALMGRGAEKYTARNWEQAAGQEELDRFKASAARHFVQWMAGERDEDHAAAVAFNLMGAEFVRDRIRVDEELKVEPANERYWWCEINDEWKLCTAPSGHPYEDCFSGYWPCAYDANGNYIGPVDRD